MTRISLLNIFVFKIIVQTNLNNEYLSVQIIFKFLVCLLLQLAGKARLLS